MNSSIARMVGSSAHTSDTREAEDYYATDPKALQDFLNEFTKDHSLSNIIWEPACGEGNLSDLLQDKGYAVFSTDKIDRGYGAKVNFIKGENWTWSGDIITNPPYKLAQDFIEQSLSLVGPKRYAIFLLRIQFLEGQKRKAFFKAHPPKYVYVHSKRIKIWKNNDQEKYNSNALCFAWFVWEKGYNGNTEVRWI